MQRPLTSEMIEYAAADVVFLPEVFLVLRERAAEIDSKSGKSADSTPLYREILRESSKSQNYAFINKNIKSVLAVKEGTYLQAFIK